MNKELAIKILKTLSALEGILMSHRTTVPDYLWDHITGICSKLEGIILEEDK